MAGTRYGHLQPGFLLGDNLIQPFFIIQPGGGEDLLDHPEYESHLRIQTFCLNAEHAAAGLQIIRPGQDMHAAEDSAGVGVDFIKQFIVTVVLRIHVTQHCL